METPPLLIAVCTNRAPERIAPTLRALGEQLRDHADVRGVIVANATPASEAQLRDLAEETGFELDLFEPTGIAAARNRALELADSEGVLAFIDDDVIPASDWLMRLEELWASAPEDVGIIGGRISPRWLEPPPRWVSPRLDVVFSLMDRGEGFKPLLPGREDAFTVNGSFRVEALRRAGGFDPRLGHREGQTMFGEDTEVQVRTAALGYRGLYVGDLRVEHVIGPERMTLRSVFRRRFYNGVSMRMTGQWSFLDGLARLLGGATEAALAFVLRRHAVMAEGVSRVGSGAGVLSAPLMRRRLERRGRR